MSIAPRKILVPVDFSAKSVHALRTALALAADECEVILLHVIETIAGVPFEEEREFYERLEQKATGAMDELVSEVQAPASETLRFHLMYGRRVDSIVDFAEQEQVDLIVLGSHAVEAEAPTRGWITVSYSVGVLAQCAVLLLKGSADGRTQ